MLRTYHFGNSRFRRSQIEGFLYNNTDFLLLDPLVEKHIIFFPPIDSGRSQTMWGRFSCYYNLPTNGTFTLKGVATNEKEMSFLEQKKWDLTEGLVITGHKDVLLYELKGRYLWCCLEVSGFGEGSISEICVDLPGDNFMATFPEIYQKEGTFFHRYLSIFSSMYYDFQKKIDNSFKLLNIDQAPSELLIIYAKWFGLSIEGEILDEEVLQELLKNIYALYQMKGTKKALKKLVRILIHEDCIIVERNHLKKQVSQEEEETLNRLYGNHMYRITIMINKKVEEKTQAKLMFFLKQFLPIRSSLKLVFYGDCSIIDSYCYLDVNAKIHKTSIGVLDEENYLNQSMM